MAHHHAHRNARAQYPDRAQFLATVDWLMERARAGDLAVRNSLGGLRHIRQWPSFDGGLRCFAGRAFVMIEANGDVVPCDRILYDSPLPNSRTAGVAAALAQLPEVRCPGCGYLGSLELNRLLNLSPDAAPAILRVVRGG
jgi:MoaA/NifB/PqqE/SkfB family radical SAM enzyme